MFLFIALEIQRRMQISCHFYLMLSLGSKLAISLTYHIDGILGNSERVIFSFFTKGSTAHHIDMYSTQNEFLRV